MTWLIDPEQVKPFDLQNYLPMEKGYGGCLIRLGIARDGEDSGLVAEADDRFE